MKPKSPRQIDQEPRQHRFWDERTRRWQTRIPKKFARNYAFFCLAVLGLIFWKRDELVGDSATFFGIVTVFAIGAGVMLANWLYDLY